MKDAVKKATPAEGQIASFIRQRDYRVIRGLGEGACGKTVLLHDDQIDEHFVCKKYRPYLEAQRVELYEGFVREIKLLHRVNHKNVVRVFNYYLYPTIHTGFILMEYVNGAEIDAYVKRCPDTIDDCFAQTITGFAHLESCGILHRDVRTQNLMVTAGGTVKIIDLGFGKKIESSADFKKSVSLNWHCSPPAEFANSIYDFTSKIYFVGRLFDNLIRENGIKDFKYGTLLANMCAARAEHRPASFRSIETEVQSGRFSELEFDEDDICAYRQFASDVFSCLAKIEVGAAYITDPERVLASLTDAFRVVSMEQTVPDASKILGCLLIGGYHFNRRRELAVESIRLFLDLLNRSSAERRRVILANLHSKLDAVDRYSNGPFDDSDIPF